MNTKLLLAATLVCGLLIGCTTTRTTTTIDPVTGATNTVTVKVPDPATTEQVKDVAQSLIGSAFRRLAFYFPKESDEAAKYASAVGTVLCEMSHTQQFEPLDLEKAVYAIAEPLITDPQAKLIVFEARDAVLLIYTTFWNQKLTAEMPSDEWPGAVAEILCNALDRALIDTGHPSVKPVVTENTLGPTTKEALRKVLGQ